MAQIQQVQLANNTSAQATNDSVSVLTVEIRDIRAALSQTQQQLAMFTSHQMLTHLQTHQRGHTHKHHHTHTYHLLRLTAHLSLMHQQRTLRFRLTSISQHHTPHADVVVNNGALAVEEEVAGHAKDDKTTLQRPQNHHLMEERDQHPI